MQVALDNCDRTTVYADLRDQESLTDVLRARAIERARQLGAQHIEFWRSPYGRRADRMEGFIEFARVPSAPEPEREAGEPSHRTASQRAAQPDQACLARGETSD